MVNFFFVHVSFILNEKKINTTHTNSPEGIAIDPSGYSLVISYSDGTLSIFDPSGSVFVADIETITDLLNSQKLIIGFFFVIQ